MNPTYEDRARVFIDSVVQNLDGTCEDAEKGIENLGILFNQYKSTVKDYVAAKGQYIDYIQKYQRDNEYAVSTSMPGITNSLPRYTQEEMVTESEEMIQLGDLVKELRNQIEMIESSLEKILGRLVNNVHESSSLAGQASAYFDSLIDKFGDAGGVYNIAGLGSTQ